VSAPQRTVRVSLLGGPLDGKVAEPAQLPGTRPLRIRGEVYRPTGQVDSESRPVYAHSSVSWPPRF